MDIGNHRHDHHGHDGEFRDHHDHVGASGPSEHGHEHHDHSHSGVRGFLTSLWRPHSHDATESLDDALTSLAVVLGAGGVWLGFPQADPLVGLGITVAILFILKDAAAQIWQRLMDAVDPSLLEQLRRAAGGAAGVEAVTMLRARWIGHGLQCELGKHVREALLAAALHLSHHGARVSAS